MKKGLFLLLLVGFLEACNKDAGPATPTPTPLGTTSTKTGYLIYDSTAYEYNPSQGYFEQSQLVTVRDSLMIDTSAPSRANYFWVIGQDTFRFTDTAHLSLVSGSFYGIGRATTNKMVAQAAPPYVTISKDSFTIKYPTHSESHYGTGFLIKGLLMH